MYLSKAVSKQNKMKLLMETKKIYRLFTILQEETNKGETVPRTTDQDMSWAALASFLRYYVQ